MIIIIISYLDRGEPLPDAVLHRRTRDGCQLHVCEQGLQHDCDGGRGLHSQGVVRGGTGQRAPEVLLQRSQRSVSPGSSMLLDNVSRQFVPRTFRTQDLSYKV